MDGKVAVVTGGSRGIGRAIALGLAEAGAQVVISSRSESACEEAVALIESSGGQALAAAADVTDTEALSGVFEMAKERAGGVDVFVHCAGLSSVGLAKSVAPEELQKMLEVHYLAGVQGCQMARESMAARGGGSIVLVSSVWGLGGHPASLAYGAAKAALAHSIKVLAIEWARYAIRVNGIAPGFVDTDMTSEMDDETRQRLLKRVPLRRSARPEEMAGPAVFLASDMSSYMTGQMLVVDGGERAR